MKQDQLQSHKVIVSNKPTVMQAIQATQGRAKPQANTLSLQSKLIKRSVPGSLPNGCPSLLQISFGNHFPLENTFLWKPLPFGDQGKNNRDPGSWCTGIPAANHNDHNVGKPKVDHHKANKVGKNTLMIGKG